MVMDRPPVRRTVLGSHRPFALQFEEILKSMFSCVFACALRILAGTLLFTLSSVAWSMSRQDLDHYLLLRDDPAEVQLALVTLEQGRAPDVRTLDLLAQRLVESPLPAADDSARLRVLQTFVRMLARGGDARYVNTLQILQRKWAGHALQTEVTAALARLPAGENAEGYKPGSFTVAGERNRLDALLRGGAMAANRRAPLPRSGLNSVQQVLARVGVPDHIGLFVDAPEYDLLSGGSFKVRMRQVLARHLEFVYFGRGSIVFYFDDEWRPVHTVAELRHPAFGHVEQPVVAHKLMSSDATAVRSLARQLYGQGSRLDPDLLDIMADRVWLRMHALDPVEAEALSILVLMLGNHTRYRLLLQDVATGARDTRLSALARKMLLKLPAAGESEDVYQRRLLPIL